MGILEPSIKIIKNKSNIIKQPINNTNSWLVSIKPNRLSKENIPFIATIEDITRNRAGSTKDVKLTSLDAPIPSKLEPVSIAARTEINFPNANI